MAVILIIPVPNGITTCPTGTAVVLQRSSSQSLGYISPVRWDVTRSITFQLWDRKDGKPNSWKICFRPGIYHCIHAALSWDLAAPAEQIGLPSSMQKDDNVLSEGIDSFPKKLNIVFV